MFLLLQRRLAWAVNSAMLVAFCFVAAHWTWDFLAPKEVALLPQEEIAPRHLAESIAAAHVFGGGAPREAQLPSGIRLDGIFAQGTGEPGAAIFVEEGKGSHVVLAGGEVSPGFFLEEIAGDHVVLNHGGARVTLKIRQIAPELDLNEK